MKNKKKKIIILIAILLVVALGVFLFFKLTEDDNKINILEKRWITNNSKNNNNIGVVNNVSVIAKDGEGMLFDFFNDLKDAYGLNFNFISDGSLGLVNVKTSFNKNVNGEVFYTDHYVLIGKEYSLVKSMNELVNKNIGMLKSDKELFDLLDNTNITTTLYDSEEDMLNAFTEGKVNLLFVPELEYADFILTSSSKIVYHLNDLEKVYYIENGKEDTFNSVIKKYYYAWKKESLEKSYNNNLLNLLKESLEISDKDYDILTSKAYSYGLINYDPYEIYDDSKLKGLVGQYINRFSNVTDVEFDIKEYNALSKLATNISTSAIDVYFGYYVIDSKYNAILTPMDLSYYVISSSEDAKTYHTINSLKNVEIYVLKNSLLHQYLKNNSFSNIKTYEDESDLKSLNKDKKLIIINDMEYQFYDDYLSNATIRYSGNTRMNYSFYVDGDATFNKIFAGFISLMDYHELAIKGTTEYIDVLNSSNLLYLIAKYFIFLVILALLFLYFKYRTKNRVIISKRIRRDDKVKYIDSLTSIKNRAYLSDNIEAWNKNRVYPQTTIIVDLNNIAYINDNFGSTEGDKQIKAAANVLIKTQLDNSDIIRTDGNEFLVYLIGYEEKKIANYLRKLYKEFGKLPYDYGAAIGYSMINDDIKTLDDAINEATIDMRSKKEIEENVEEIKKDN